MRKAIILGLALGGTIGATILLWKARKSEPAPVTTAGLPSADSSEREARQPPAFQTLRSGGPAGSAASLQTGENTPVEVFSSSWGFQPTRISAESARRQKERRDQELQGIISKDVAEGVNAEARAKEARLRGLVGQLRVDFSPEEAFQVLGQPDVLRSNLRGPHRRTR